MQSPQYQSDNIIIKHYNLPDECENTRNTCRRKINNFENKSTCGLIYLFNIYIYIYIY